MKGKGLFFVNTTDGGYRLKLFLEQFHIRSAVLNAELPLHSRLNIIKQFNVGNFDYLIATDESSDVTTGSNDDDDDDDEASDEEMELMDGEENDEQQQQQQQQQTAKKKKKKRQNNKSKKKDSEYGVSRGLDFRGVSFVVNVDFPPSCQSYTHRIGRTARGGASGVALSLVNMDDAQQESMLAQVQESQPPLPGAGVTGNDTLQSAPDTEVDDSGQERLAQQQLQPTPLDFDLAEIEGFRYRVEDVSRAVTKVAVKETRAAELRAEILNSQRLHSHFEENPSDLQLLRHDRLATHVSKVQEHLRNVPSYLLPRGLQVVEKKKKRKRRNNNRRRDATRRKDNDPLHCHDGAGVTLDGVATVEAGDQPDTENPNQMDDSEYFNDGLDNDSDDNGDDDNKKQKMDRETYEGLGKSTAGRQKWKERHNKGQYSNKSRTGKKKKGIDGQFFT